MHRGGIAQLSAMFSHEYLADLRRAHREGGFRTGERSGPHGLITEPSPAE